MLAGIDLPPYIFGVFALLLIIISLTVFHAIAFNIWIYKENRSKFATVMFWITSIITCVPGFILWITFETVIFAPNIYWFPSQIKKAKAKKQKKEDKMI
ncbi:hypothetical protein SHELI_v1c00540 [Spiroplasma helicoides]|uniref:Uncharacterized protein n=1 Tax=Spiroplasma helicoides TaxID=216938 RepID=A0A1B3SJA3_9MOLU|nr:hypothetical protein [Spiroplasma helicoides]AOG60009.1 hypothetical protein SHELI_v1c00540 [Spiroplasma helicoides]